MQERRRTDGCKVGVLTRGGRTLHGRGHLLITGGAILGILQLGLEVSAGGAQDLSSICLDGAGELATR